MTTTEQHRRAPEQRKASEETNARVALMVKMLVVVTDHTMTEVASQLEITRQALYDRLAGRVPFTLGDLAVLATFFEVPITAFFKDPADLFGPDFPKSGSRCIEPSPAPESNFALPVAS